jgi:membrane protein involved in colicin uptake
MPENQRANYIKTKSTTIGLSYASYFGKTPGQTSRSYEKWHDMIHEEVTKQWGFDRGERLRDMTPQERADHYHKNKKQLERDRIAAEKRTKEQEEKEKEAKLRREEQEKKELEANARAKVANDRAKAAESKAEEQEAVVDANAITIGKQEAAISNNATTLKQQNSSLAAAIMSSSTFVGSITSVVFLIG